MTDADAIRHAGLAVASAFLLGFGGFTFAFATAMSTPGANAFGLVLVVIAVGTALQSRKLDSDQAARDPATATDGGCREAEA